MHEIDTEQGAIDRQPLRRGGKRVGRRTALKAGVAVVGGVTLGTTYVKPELRSVSLSETAYASGNPDANNGGKDNPKTKDKKPKDPKP